MKTTDGQGQNNRIKIISISLLSLDYSIVSSPNACIGDPFIRVHLCVFAVRAWFCSVLCSYNQKPNFQTNREYTRI